MDIVEILIEKLPSRIEYEGVLFDFYIHHNQSSLEMGYKVYQALIDSKHFKDVNSTGKWRNPFRFNILTYNLCYFVAIDKVWALRLAIQQCSDFLKEIKNPTGS